MGPGLIVTTVANLRLRPSHKSELLTQSLLGEEISIVKSRSLWSQVICRKDDYCGWMENGSFAPCTMVELQTFHQDSKRVNFLQADFLEKATKQSQILLQLVMGCRLRILGSVGKYFEVCTPSKERGFVAKTAFNEFLPSPPRERLQSIAFACLGIHYLWGGSTPKGLDCSGFVQLVMRECGINLPRDAQEQSEHGIKISNIAKFQFGDLLFFGSVAGKKTRVTHVALCLGDGMYVHASSFVRIHSLHATNPLFNGYRRKTLLFARRLGDQFLK